MYTYLHSEHSADHDLYTVGHYDPQGKFQPESDHSTKEEAANRVIVLNGGKLPETAPSPLPASVGEPAKEFEKALDNYARTVLTNDEWDNDYQGQWLGGKVQYLGAHSRFFTGIKSSPPASSVGELPEQLECYISNNQKSVHVRDCSTLRILTETVNDNEGRSDAAELVKRYNAYHELERKVKDLIAGDTLHEIKYEKLQEQNRVLVNAIKTMKAFMESSAGNPCPEPIRAVLMGEILYAFTSLTK